MTTFVSQHIIEVIVVYICLMKHAGLIPRFKQQMCCWDFLNAVDKCRPLCDKGYFSLYGMSDCHPWLTCKDISDVPSGSILGAGAVKIVILGSWHGYPVVINKLRNETYKDDFMHGLNMIKLFQPNPQVIQLVGFCPQKNIYLTEYHHFGSADHLEAILNFQKYSLKQKHGSDLDVIRTKTFRPVKLFLETELESVNDGKICLIYKTLTSEISTCSLCESPQIRWMGLSEFCSGWMNSNSKVYVNNLDVNNENKILKIDYTKIPNCHKNLNCLPLRFQLCLDYIAILSFLHNSPDGTHIMCDSNNVLKTLSQYLLTDDLRLIVNDLDALPYVNYPIGITAKCGHREITGDFVAPEQLWPFEDKKFNDDDMPGYDEKTDIWKIPEICDTFIGNIPGGTTLKLHLFNINTKCKDEDAKNRPSSKEVFAEYNKIWRKLNKNL